MEIGVLTKFIKKFRSAVLFDPTSCSNHTTVPMSWNHVVLLQLTITANEMIEGNRSTDCICQGVFYATSSPNEHRQTLWFFITYHCESRLQNLPKKVLDKLAFDRFASTSSIKTKITLSYNGKSITKVKQLRSQT